LIRRNLRSPVLQVAALTEYPELMTLAKDVFPADVIERAQELLAEIGSIGAYSHSQGVPFIRKSVAKFIEGAKARENFCTAQLTRHQSAMDTLPIRTIYS
jgi:aspartate/methionine/tyrosine aminotransferase